MKNPLRRLLRRPPTFRILIRTGPSPQSDSSHRDLFTLTGTARGDSPDTFAVVFTQDIDPYRPITLLVHATTGGLGLDPQRLIPTHAEASGHPYNTHLSAASELSQAFSWPAIRGRFAAAVTALPDVHVAVNDSGVHQDREHALALIDLCTNDRLDPAVRAGVLTALAGGYTGAVADLRTALEAATAQVSAHSGSGPASHPAVTNCR